MRGFNARLRAKSKGYSQNAQLKSDQNKAF
jgi:hypothetical protein